MHTDIKRICFTGPRPKNLYGYHNRDAYMKLSTYLSETLNRYADAGTTDFISGGAQDFDQLAFWMIHNKVKPTHPNVKNNVYIPFTGQELCWAETGMFGQNEYRQMLAHADLVHDCNTTPEKQENAICLLMKRNEIMVDNADFVIGCYSRRKNYHTDKGGTAACLRYAVKQNKSVLIIDPDTYSETFL